MSEEVDVAGKGMDGDQSAVTTGDTVEQPDELVKQLENLKRQLDGEKAKSEDYLRRWQRAQADFVNFKRRMEQERAELLRYANASLVSKLLPILDDFERAEASLPGTLRHLSWIEGIFLIRLRLQAILQQEGLSRIEALGKDFDPVDHEAVIVEPDVDPGRGQVVEELQTGYRLGDRTIRPTLVKVGRHAQPAEDGQGQEPGDTPREQAE